MWIMVSTIYIRPIHYRHDCLLLAFSWYKNIILSSYCLYLDVDKPMTKLKSCFIQFSHYVILFSSVIILCQTSLVNHSLNHCLLSNTHFHSLPTLSECLLYCFQHCTNISTTASRHDNIQHDNNPTNTHPKAPKYPNKHVQISQTNL